MKFLWLKACEQRRSGRAPPVTQVPRFISKGLLLHFLKDYSSFLSLSHIFADIYCQHGGEVKAKIKSSSLSPLSFSTHGPALRAL